MLEFSGIVTRFTGEKDVGVDGTCREEEAAGLPIALFLSLSAFSRSFSVSFWSFLSAWCWTWESKISLNDGVWSLWSSFFFSYTLWLAFCKKVFFIL